MNKFEQTRSRYASDLRILRKLQNVSLETVHMETRIIKTVLQDYEKNCLLNNSNFARVYLHSLTEAYAKAVGLDVDQILNALEMALDGTYDGRLNPDYRPQEESPSEPVSISPKESASTKEPKSGASSPSEDKVTDGG